MPIFKKERLAAIEKRADLARSHGILVVDDEEANIQTLSFLLKARYEVFSARDGQEAIEKMSDPEFAKRVQLIICDQRMPKLTGVQFFQRVIDIAPTTIRILLTGYTDIQSIIESINQAHIYKFMLKPFDHQDLLVTIQRALETYDLRKKLEENHRSLENMVRQRTHELEEANQELRRNHEELIRAQGQLIMREKMAFLGTMTARIAHELKNPLNFIINFAATADETTRQIVCAHASALADLPAGDDGSVLDLMREVRSATERITLHGKRANEIIGLMLKHSQESTAPKEPMKLNEVLSRYVDLAHQSASRPQNAEVELKIEKDFDSQMGTVVLSNLGIGRVVTSLVTNSIESVMLKRRKHGASFEPCIRVRTRRLSDKVEIRIWDNGVGIPSKVLPQIFHPFFTTKADSKNIGLGLAIAYDIVVQEHDGQLEVHAEENEYAEFVVRLHVP